jgi:DNA polymerase I-like protein with 3'-5' exonuclease and polymerase domains/uracil-DNA glycosylase
MQNSNIKDFVPNQLFNNPIAVVIDTPDAKDVVKGKLLQDYCGLQFSAKLAQWGISTNEISLLSVAQVKHPRPDYMSASERLAWMALLERELNRCAPKVIIVVGETALRALTNEINIKKHKGTPIKCKLCDALVVPIEHYKELLYNESWQTLADFYIQKVLTYVELDRGTMPSKNVNVIVTTDWDLLEREFLNEDYLSNPESLLGFDIECSKAEMTCIGFAKDETTAYVIPCVHVLGKDLPRMIRTIDKILRSPVPKVAQNGNFDITYQGYNYKIKVNNFAWDTMLAWHSVFPNLPKGLDTISSVCTDEPYWKDDGKQWMLPYDQINWPQFFEYNGRDCCNLLTIVKVEKELLTLRGTWDTFNREMALCYPLIAMELDGVHINQPVVEQMKAETGELIRKWELFLNTLLGEELAINANSPDQVKTLLYDKLKLPRRIRQGKRTADEDALLSLIPLNPLVVKPILIIRKLKKEHSEYKVKIGIDGQMRACFKPAGTMTGRLASAKTIIDGSGTNFQNRTKKIRIYFVPDPVEENDPDENLFINADYSKAESWIVAALAMDDKMMEILQGPDFHSANATNILGHKVTKENYKDYQLGKRVSHGANYRMTAYLLQKVLLKEGYTFSLSDTKELMELYHSCYPNIRKVFHAFIEREVRARRPLVNFFGRKVNFTTAINDTVLNSATAWIPQGTVGDMTNQGLINVYQTIPEVRLKLQVHDSIVMQALRSYIKQQLIDRIINAMQYEFNINGYKFTIPVDVEIGPNWKELDDWDKVKHKFDSNYKFDSNSNLYLPS